MPIRKVWKASKTSRESDNVGQPWSCLVARLERHLRQKYIPSCSEILCDPPDNGVVSQCRCDGVFMHNGAPWHQAKVRAEVLHEADLKVLP